MPGPTIELMSDQAKAAAPEGKLAMATANVDAIPEAGRSVKALVYDHESCLQHVHLRLPPFFFSRPSLHNPSWNTQRRSLLRQPSRHMFPHVCYLGRQLLACITRNVCAASGRAGPNDQKGSRAGVSRDSKINRKRNSKTTPNNTSNNNGNHSVGQSG